MTGVKRPFSDVDTNPTESQSAKQQNSSQKAAGKVASQAAVCKSPRTNEGLSSSNSQSSDVGLLVSSANQPLSPSSHRKPISLRPSSTNKVAVDPRKTRSEVLPSINDTTCAAKGRRASTNFRSSSSSGILGFYSSSSVETAATKSLVAHSAILHDELTKSGPSSPTKEIKTGNTGIKIIEKVSKSGFVKLIKPVPVPGSTKRLVGKLIIRRPSVDILPNDHTLIDSPSSEESIKSRNSGSSKNTKTSNNGSTDTTKQSSKTRSINRTKVKPSKEIFGKLDDLDPEAMRVVVRKSALEILASLARKNKEARKNSSNSCLDKTNNKKEEIPTQDTPKHGDNAEVLPEREQETVLAVPTSPERKNENAATEEADRNKSSDDDNNDVNSKEMENNVKLLPPQRIADKADRTINTIDFDTLKRLGCRAKMRSMLWTSKFQAKLEITSKLSIGKPVLEGQKKLFSHVRKLAEKAFRKVNDYRYYSGEDKLEWNEMLYEACSSCNCEMIGGGRYRERPNFNLGTDSCAAAIPILLRGEAVVARREGYVNELVTEAMLNEFKNRKYHNLTLLNSYMRYGAIDIFGNEENFSALIVMSRQPPFQFSIRRRDT